MIFVISLILLIFGGILIKISTGWGRTAGFAMIALAIALVLLSFSLEYFLTDEI